MQKQAVASGESVKTLAVLKVDSEWLRELPDNILESLFSNGRECSSSPLSPVASVHADHTGQELQRGERTLWHHGYAKIAGDYELNDMSPSLWAILWTRAVKQATEKAQKNYEKTRTEALESLEQMTRNGITPTAVHSDSIRMPSRYDNIPAWCLSEEEWRDASDTAAQMIKNEEYKREKLKEENDRKQKEADARKHLQLTEIVDRFGTPTQKQKWHDGMMAIREAIDLFTEEQVQPIINAGFQVFEPGNLGVSDLKHADWCPVFNEIPEYDYDKEDYKVEKLTDTEYEHLQSLRKAVPDGSTITPTVEQLTCNECKAETRTRYFHVEWKVGELWVEIVVPTEPYGL